MACKGVCIRFKAPKPPPHQGGRYGLGQKRCQICGLFIQCDNLWCPCCHYRLRIRPHNPKSKKAIDLIKQMNLAAQPIANAAMIKKSNQSIP